MFIHCHPHYSSHSPQCHCTCCSWNLWNSLSLESHMIHSSMSLRPLILSCPLGPCGNITSSEPPSLAILCTRTALIPTITFCTFMLLKFSLPIHHYMTVHYELISCQSFHRNVSSRNFLLISIPVLKPRNTPRT